VIRIERMSRELEKTKKKIKKIKTNQDFGEVVLKLGSSKVQQNFTPLRRIVVLAKIWLQLASQNFQCRRLSDTVCTHQTEHLSGSWYRQSMQLEGVGTISTKTHTHIHIYYYTIITCLYAKCETISKKKGTTK
jgi:hypothetical protein